MRQPKLLITGSSGLIGSILVKGLTDTFEIHGVDMAATPDDGISRADLSDHDQIFEVLRRLVPLPYIVHLAGDPRDDADWPSVLKNNIIGTRNLYEAARECGVKRVVFASSNHVTGAYERFPPSLHESPNPQIITVRVPIRPDGDYGTSKAFGEAIARQYFELHGIESVCLRIGSVVEDDDPTVDERYRSTWLSHRDLVQLVRKSLLADVKFGIYYGVSNNKNRFWDILNAREDIGYEPVDDASAL